MKNFFRIFNFSVSFKKTDFFSFLFFVFFFLGFFSMFASCTKKKSESSKSEPVQKGSDSKSVASPLPESVRAEARAIFKSRCVTCHGENGAGDGPASKGLVPAPKDFTDSKWQKASTDDYLEKIIKFGGASVGKAATMPPNPDLNGKPQVLQALVEFIRSLEGKKK